MRFISKITISVHQFQEGPSNTTGLYRIPRSLNSVLLHFVFLLVFFAQGFILRGRGASRSLSAPGLVLWLLALLGLTVGLDRDRYPFCNFGVITQDFQ